MLYLLFYSATEERMDDRMLEAEEKEVGIHHISTDLSLDDCERRENDKRMRIVIVLSKKC